MNKRSPPKRPRASPRRARRRAPAAAAAVPVGTATAPPTPPPVEPGTIVIAPQPGFQTQVAMSTATITVCGGAAGCGKRLDIATPIATPNGWTTMGDLQPGDTVFDDRGYPTTVTYVSPVMVASESYCVRFSDGSTVVADAEHLWKTITYRERGQRTKRTPEARARRRAERPKRGQGINPQLAEANARRAWSVASPPTGDIRTTAEVAATLFDRGRLNHVVTVACALHLPAAVLPIDPYVLGAWLGDGAGVDAVVYGIDADVFNEIRAAGFEVHRIPSTPCGYRVTGLRARLGEMGQLGPRSERKHIPLAYLRASKAQRLALLQGLMDTDGHANPAGNCEFTTTKRRLRDDVMELILSLGIKVTCYEGRATLRGRDCGPKWRLLFYSADPVFRLKRKLSQQKRAGFRGRMVFERAIVAVERVSPVKMRCIAVEAPSHLYLAGRAMIPTHNTMIEIIEAVRDALDVPGYTALFFRRTIKQVENPGGLWDEAGKWYPMLGGRPRAQKHEYWWPGGGSVRFSHLQHESNIIDWQGSQPVTVIFDEAPHFSAAMIWYLFGRIRSTIRAPDGCLVRGRMLLSCNPDADSWVAELIAWWIDQDPKSPGYGFPIPSRAGKLRWFTRVDEQLVWGDTPEEVMRLAPGTKRVDVNSLTFIPGKLEENKLGDPRYRGKLMAMSRVQRKRLLDGNWKVRPVAGDYYKRDEFQLLKEPPPLDDLEMIVRGWDLAASEPSDANPDPDWTVGVKMARRISTGKFVILHVIYKRWRSQKVRRLVKRTAIADGAGVTVVFPKDPAQAGVFQADTYLNMLAGFNVYPETPTGDKETRQEPFSAQVQAGNVEIVEAAWNEWYFGLMEAFPTKGVKDDPVDASASAFHQLIQGVYLTDVLDGPARPRLGEGKPEEDEDENLPPGSFFNPDD